MGYLCDVTLNYPFSPPAHGREQVGANIERAASQFRDGELVSAEIIEKHASPELAYVVEIERGEAKIGGSEEITPWVLTATCVSKGPARECPS